MASSINHRELCHYETRLDGGYLFLCELVIGGQIIRVRKEKTVFRLNDEYELVHTRSVDNKYYTIRQTFEKELARNYLFNNNHFLMTSEVVETNMENEEEIENFKQIWDEQIIPQFNSNQSAGSFDEFLSSLHLSWSLDSFGEENNQDWNEAYLNR